MTGPDVKQDSRVYENMCAKLHPNRVVGASDKMYFIISTIVGQEWVTNDESYGQFSITTDGSVWDSFFISDAGSFERNVWGYVDVADLTPKQREYFEYLYRNRVHDWRRA